MNKIKKINIIYFITVLISILGSFFASYIYITTNNMVFTLLVSQVLLILPALAYIIGNKFDLRKTIRFNKIKFSNILLIIIFSYLAIPLMTLINLISMLFVKNNIQNTVEVIINENPLYVSIFAIALIPCIFEETVYRGIFYNEYRKVSVINGILLSALLFALLHMNFNQFFYAFVMGIIFVILIEATDSILSSMIMHFIINGTSVFNVYMVPKLQDMLEEIDPEYVKDLAEGINTNFTRTELLVSISSLWPIVLITTIFAAIILFAITKNSNRVEYMKAVFHGEQLNEVKSDVMSEDYEYTQNEVKNNRLITMPLIIGIITCLVFMVLSEIL